MEIDIDQESFVAWKKDPTTVKIYAILQDIKEEISFNLMSDKVILSQPLGLEAVRLAGVREGLDYLLEATSDQEITIVEEND